MTNGTGENVTELLKQLGAGDQSAASKLIPLVYNELHRLAAAYMRRERPDHTLQATALINEAFLKLSKQEKVDWRGRAHFFAIAAEFMHRILVDHARKHLRYKRGGGEIHVPLDEALVLTPERSLELVRLDDALERLAKLDPRQSRIVELRFFGGLSVEKRPRLWGFTRKK